LSELINEKLRMKIFSEKPIKEPKKRLHVRLGKKLSPEKIEKLIREGWDEVLKWKL